MQQTLNQFFGYGNQTDYIVGNSNSKLKNKLGMTILFENWDSKKNGYVTQSVDLTNEPTIQDFIKKAKLENYLSKVATIESKTDNKCEYQVIIESIYKKHIQWAYVLVVGNRIIKCGDSTMTLQGRWSSYSAGTRQNRDRGTCSTTNYFISEIIRQSLKNGLSVELYAYPIPNIIQPIDVFGVTKNALCDFVTYYESELLQRFSDIYNKKPIVGKNGLVK
jgi:hypothetical protein